MKKRKSGTPEKREKQRMNGDFPFIRSPLLFQEQLQNQGGKKELAVIRPAARMCFQDVFQFGLIEYLLFHADTVQQAFPQKFPPFIAEP